MSAVRNRPRPPAQRPPTDHGWGPLTVPSDGSRLLGRPPTTQHPVHVPHGLPPAAFSHVGVDVHGDSDPRVPQDLHPGREQQGGDPSAIRSNDWLVFLGPTGQPDRDDSGPADPGGVRVQRSRRLAAREVSVSSRSHGFNSRCTTRGAGTSITTLRLISSSRFAAVSTLRSVRCDSFAVAAEACAVTAATIRRTSGTPSVSSQNGSHSDSLAGRGGPAPDVRLIVIACGVDEFQASGAGPLGPYIRPARFCEARSGWALRRLQAGPRRLRAARARRR